jgi:hypothetical protein
MEKNPGRSSDRAVRRMARRGTQEWSLDDEVCFLSVKDTEK